MAYGEIEHADGGSLAYEHVEGRGPGILFCSGFNSTMQGVKALALQRWCLDHQRQFTRFDYFGHGQSCGEFSAGTIGRWASDTLLVLDEITRGPQIIVGSSMGGWMMLLAALARPERIVALLGLAAAPDFTARLAAERLSAAQKQQIATSGYCDIANCYDDGEDYKITAQLLSEAERHLLLDKPIAINVPVRLLHGQRDDDVPWQTSLRLSQQLTSEDVEVQLIKNSDHRLSSAEDLRRLYSAVDELIAKVECVDVR